MTDHEEKMQKQGLRDRKTWLVVFGILQIIFGGLCAVLVPLMILGMVASTILDNDSTATMSVPMMLPGMLVYVLLAVWFIWMGIGSIKARRWARSLILISSWIWLISGIGGLLAVLALMPDMYDKMGESGQMPSEIVAVMKYVMIGFMTVLYVIIPGVLVLFYGSKNVKATCEFRDPQIRWSDKCPLPVLAVSGMFCAGALFTPLGAFYGCVVPFFGFLVSGITGAIVLLVFTLMFGSLAWGIYKLRIMAWWGAIALTILGGMSAMITFSRVSLLEVYEKMNFPEQQIELMRQYSMPEKFSITLYTAIWVAGFLGYLLYTRRYFVCSLAQEKTSREPL